jgi:hypothetical protein
VRVEKVRDRLGDQLIVGKHKTLAVGDGGEKFQKSRLLDLVPWGQKVKTAPFTPPPPPDSLSGAGAGVVTGKWIKDVSLKKRDTIS